MRVLIFCHSILSDWNHGNAHFLRGITTELISRGHDVQVLEPEDAWSVQNLIADQGAVALERFRTAYPTIHAERYRPSELDLDTVLNKADLVILHEWNDPELVRAVGEHRKKHPGYRLFFHDSHHRAATAPQEMARFELGGYDGVLAFGAVIRDLYLSNGWAERAWTWHEAADIRVFHPVVDTRGLRPSGPDPVQGYANARDLVWIGNWGDGERTAELEEFLFEPVRALRLKATVYGVRYPAEALQKLEAAGIAYGGYLPNYRVPEVYGQFRCTVHVPRGPYAAALPGIPTIRVFEALACAIPLFSAPWQDTEQLFEQSEEYFLARNGTEMTGMLERALAHPEEAQGRARCGFEKVQRRHTCAHRVDELLEILRELR